ncbi:NAD(P)-binding domain-containing protein [Prosthecomicrobium sp. N25]|uniref:NAD(P)-binding domain-containing protein n=1 Tax=Prosthecomicrobium sp. N25 TaxID=3129254 RepID=UPI00307821AD
MTPIDTVVIGAGQAGLAMSRSLAARGIEHVVLERGRVGERWRRGSWDSLRLLTPDRMSALPGLPHRSGPEFLPARAFVDYLERYADFLGAPVIEAAPVRSVTRAGARFRVEVGGAVWAARAVVVATGAYQTPYVPPVATGLPRGILQVAAARYRRPSALPDGGVLVVGASATGLQIAEEILGSGRPVTIAAGEHTRMPRRWRGEDIYVRLAQAGVLDDVPPPGEAGQLARAPSMQLAGRPDRRDIDLGFLAQAGARVAGRLLGVADGVARLGDLAGAVARAQARMERTLDRIDRALAAMPPPHPGPPAERPAPLRLPPAPEALDLAAEGIRTVVWATGYRRTYPWLHLPVLDGTGEIRQEGGITSEPGLYTLGLTFMRRRQSHFICGCGADAEALGDEIAAHLGAARCRPGPGAGRRAALG